MTGVAWRDIYLYYLEVRCGARPGARCACGGRCLQGRVPAPTGVCFGRARNYRPRPAGASHPPIDRCQSLQNIAFPDLRAGELGARRDKISGARAAGSTNASQWVTYTTGRTQPGETTLVAKNRGNVMTGSGTRCPESQGQAPRTCSNAAPLVIFTYMISPLFTGIRRCRGSKAPRA
ncbi:hypothetical protein CENSYa_1539 [Cenarchaeum symbiosum A]|uniref:Uncharacterized protein n=1 Tax=Cenarchaeum symbiosum (strain A) TaxID=414004 RepID=A0RXU4_CENSY|nr:hypothetical protein CENSYa_1539 [Cenarchaeum symbiosum A]